MIVFVDYEHASARTTEWGREVTRLRTEITYRLEDLAGEHCMLVRYDRLTDELLDRLEPTSIVISGNGSIPDRYTDDELAPARRLIRSRRFPMFGLCGGFQLMATTLGSELVPLGDLSDEEVDAADADRSPFTSATVTEVGYAPVELSEEHPLLEGLGVAPVFRHAHMFQVDVLPDGFRRLASSALTGIQMAVDDEHRMAGTQFHPESWTDEFPDGRRLLSNFFDWVRDGPGDPGRRPG